MSKLPLATLSLLLGLSFASAHAQQFDPSSAVAIPSTILQGSSIEHVDLMSGALQVKIPLVHLLGRGGLDFDLAASYTSKIWGANYWTDDYQFSLLTYVFGANSTMGDGWSVGLPEMMASQSGGIVCEVDNCIGPVNIYLGQITHMDGSTESVTNTAALQYVLTANDPVDCSNPYASEICFAYIEAYNTWSYDGSYTMQSSDAEFFKNGRRAIAGSELSPSGSYVSYQDVVDTNGNFIKCYFDMPTGNSCIDTVGRTITLAADSNTAPYYPFTLVKSIAYLDDTGQQHTITLTYVEQTISYYAGRNEGPECTGAGDPEFCVYDRSEEPLLQSIAIPGIGNYSFEYTVNPDGTSSGELSKLTLPTGGYIRYTYMDLLPNLADLIPTNRRVAQRIVSADGTAASEKTWTYSVNVPYPTSDQDPHAQPNDTVSVVDPIGNIHSESFYGKIGGQPYTQPDVYPGVYDIPVSVQSKDVDSSGAILSITKYTYGWDASEYSVLADGFAYGNPRVLQSDTTLGGSNAVETTTYQYGRFGNVTQEVNYDGITGSILRKIQKTYLAEQNTQYAAMPVHTLDRDTSESIYGTCSGANVGGQPCSLKTTVYDQLNGSGGVVPLQGVVQHDDTTYSSTWSLRGNAVAMQVGTGAHPVLVTQGYDQVGNLVWRTDANSNTTNFKYYDNYFGSQAQGLTAAYISEIDQPVTSGVPHVQRYQHYLGDGSVAAVCSDSFPTTAGCVAGIQGVQSDYKWFQYDEASRLTDEWKGDGGHINLSYTIAPGATIVTHSVLENTNPQSQLTTILFDGLGRKVETQVGGIPTSGPLVKTDFGYDALGNQNYVSNPYFAGSTSLGTTQYYDSLGRVMRAVQPDSSVRSWAYTGSTVTSIDEAGNTYQRTADGLGRLSEVIEPGGLFTKYNYDALNNLAEVDQVSTNGTSLLTRQFAYDSLSRLLWSRNPESGVTCYGHGDGSIAGCQADGYDPNGNLLTKTDARGITTTYQYDPLNRLLQRSFTDGSRTESFRYDGQGFNFEALPAPWGTNAIGRLSHTSNAVNVASIYAYDAS
jgi:YD repeat-containing protein